MKIKYILLSLTAFFVIKSAFGQDSGDSKEKYNKIKLKKYDVVQDSAVSTWGLIASTPSFANEEKSFQLREQVNDVVGVTFSTDEKKGIIYVDFENLPENNQPVLSISNESGNVINQQQVRFANNVVNMRKLPPGTYLFTADVDEEIATWEFVKE